MTVGSRLGGFLASFPKNVYYLKLELINVQVPKFRSSEHHALHITIEGFQYHHLGPVKSVHLHSFKFSWPRDGAASRPCSPWFTRAEPIVSGASYLHIYGVC